MVLIYLSTLHSFLVCRHTGHRRRRHAWRVQGVRNSMANVRGLSAGRRAGRAQFRAVSLYTGSDHSGAELRHHACDAPEQAALAEARVVHHAVWLGVRRHDGSAAAVRRV